MKRLNNLIQNTNSKFIWFSRDNLGSFDAVPDNMAKENLPALTSGKVIDAVDRFRTETRAIADADNKDAADLYGGAAVADMREGRGALARFKTKDLHPGWFGSEAGRATWNPAEWFELYFNSQGSIEEALRKNMDFVVNQFEGSPLLYSGLSRAFLSGTLESTLDAVMSAQNSSPNISTFSLDILENAVGVIEREIRNDLKRFDTEIAPTLTEDGSEGIAILGRTLAFGHDQRIRAQQSLRKSAFEDGILDIKTRLKSTRENRRKTIEQNTLVQLKGREDAIYRSGEVSHATNLWEYYAWVTQNPESFLNDPNQVRWGFNFKEFASSPAMFLDALNLHRSDRIISMQRVQRLSNDTVDVIANFNSRGQALTNLEGNFQATRKALSLISSDRQPFPEGKNGTEFLSDILVTKLQQPPRNVNVEADIFGNTIYLSAEEEVWMMLNYVAQHQNDNGFANYMDEDMRMYTAQWIFEQESELNQSLVYGGQGEAPTDLWRMRALSTAEKLITNIKDILESIENLNESLTSTDGSVASEAIQKLASLGPVYDAFVNIFGDPTLLDDKNSVLKGLQPTEAEVIGNAAKLASMRSIITPDLIADLQAKRVEYQALLKTPSGPEIDSYIRERDESQALLRQVTETTQGGTGQGRAGINIGGGGVGGTEEGTNAVDGSAIGVETSASNLENVITNLINKITNWQETIAERTGFAFKLPPNVLPANQATIDGTLKSLRALKERIDFTEDEAMHPTLDTLMKNRMRSQATDKMQDDAKRLFFNNGVQAWEEMRQNFQQGVPFRSMTYSDVTHQRELAPLGVVQNAVIHNEEMRVAQNLGDSIILEDSQRVYQIVRPSSQRPASMKIWDKKPSECGPLSENKPFSMNFTHPPKKAIFLSASPQNTHIEENAYYKNIWHEERQQSYFDQVA